MPKVTIIDTDKLPRCPYCKSELETIEKNTIGVIGKNIIYTCPKCNSILGIDYLR